MHTNHSRFIPEGVAKNQDILRPHHQRINVPTAGAQAFLIDYILGERVYHHADPVWFGRY
jgi:hypothetical protein